jgi:putative zinc finger/helix-turn-helix YgiT family protein
MSSDVIRLPNSERRRCSCCESENVQVSFETELFNYKTENGEVVPLSVHVPVWTCPSCGEQYTDERAEDIRHEAVCRHLGRLTPSEIKELREIYNLSQNQWAEISGIGIASVKRWETGSLIQGAAMDRYLRLLRDRRNVATLQKMGEQSPKLTKPQFRTELPQAAMEDAGVFQLRPSHAA